MMNANTINTGDRVVFLIPQQSYHSQATIPAGAVGTVTGIIEGELGVGLSVRVNNELWLCWAKDVKVIEEQSQ